MANRCAFMNELRGSGRAPAKDTTAWKGALSDTDCFCHRDWVRLRPIRSTIVPAVLEHTPCVYAADTLGPVIAASLPVIEAAQIRLIAHTQGQ
jgi:hypothetical protein